MQKRKFRREKRTTGSRIAAVSSVGSDCISASACSLEVEVTSHMFALAPKFHVCQLLHDVMSCSVQNPEAVTFLFSEEMRNAEMHAASEIRFNV